MRTALIVPSVSAAVLLLVAGAVFAQTQIIGCPAGHALQGFNLATRTVVCTPAGATGAAGGDLTGTYPNPTITPNAVTAEKLADGAVDTAAIQDGAVTAAKLHSSLNRTQVHDAQHVLVVPDPGGPGNFATQVDLLDMGTFTVTGTCHAQSSGVLSMTLGIRNTGQGQPIEIYSVEGGHRTVHLAITPAVDFFPNQPIALNARATLASNAVNRFEADMTSMAHGHIVLFDSVKLFSASGRYRATDDHCVFNVVVVGR